MTNSVGNFVSGRSVMWYDEERDDDAACVMCCEMTNNTIQAETVGGHTVTLALCKGCSWNPLVVEFAEWLAGQPWLWLDEEKLAELNSG